MWALSIRCDAKPHIATRASWIYGQSQDDALIRSQEEEGCRKSGLSTYDIINGVEVLSWLPITHPEGPCAQIVCLWLKVPTQGLP